MDPRLGYGSLSRVSTGGGPTGSVGGRLCRAGDKRQLGFGLHGWTHQKVTREPVSPVFCFLTIGEWTYRYGGEGGEERKETMG